MATMPPPMNALLPDPIVCLHRAWHAASHRGDRSPAIL